MTVDDQGARPLTARERRELAELERGLHTVGRAAHDHYPRVLARWLGAWCAGLTATALAAGPRAALLVAAVGAVVLVVAIVSFERRRGS